MRLFCDLLEYNDDIVCLSGGYFRIAKPLISNNNGEDIMIVPNPAKDEIKIIFKVTDKNGNCKFQIHDMLGKLYIYDKINCDQLNYIVNISELPIGTYIVTVDRSDRIPVQSKLVVIR